MNSDHNVNPDDLDTVFHSPKRLVIVAILYRVEFAEFKYLEQRVGIADFELSRQLKILRDAQLVEVKNRKPRRVSLTKFGRSSFEQYRSNLDRLIHE